MDFIFNNPLAKMPGIVFLIFYGATIILTAIFIKILKFSFDWTRRSPLPLISQNPDSFELAYLRGGENEFARAVVFGLIHKGFLTLTNDGKNSSIVLSKMQPNWTTLSALERNVLPWFQTTREAKEIFDSYGLIEILKPYSAEYERKIKQSNFLLPDDVAAKIRTSATIAGLILIFLGAYKIFIAVSNGRTNIVFTIIMMVITLIIFWILGKTSRLSQLGEKYIKAVQQAFENLQGKIQNADLSKQTAPTFGAVDPFLLAVGVFGVGALSGTMYYEYEQAFHRASVSGSSSCGSSCGSSCSSGDSGSSCSSGSSCGSGCGGCGGGD